MQMMMRFLLNPTIVSRDGWNAKAPKRKPPEMKPEVEHLVVSFTETSPCSNKEECVQRVRELQEKQVEEEGHEDIHYNFLIGGDGNVYEGRGWKQVPRTYPKKKEFERLHNNAIELAFIGRSETKPTFKMLKAFAGIVVKAVTEKVLVGNMKNVKPCLIVGNNKVLYLKEEILKLDPSKEDEKKLIDEYNKLQNES